jgi:signal transduction histidine kinase
VTLQVRNEVRRRGESEAAVRETLRQVDERVKQRTSELSLANQQLQEALDERAKALGRERKARAAAERANQLKDQFLATVSHELRTPLNAIIGWTHVLKLGALKPAEVEHALSAIDRNAKAQTQLIADLLDVSRMTQGRLILERVPTNLREVVDVAVEKMRPAIQAKGLTLQYQSGESHVPVLGDAGRLQQVVRNLLSNALKFTKEGQIEVELLSDGAFAELRVRDTGEGIPPDMLPQIFEPFVQGRTDAKRTGLGLGLAIVRDVVGLHGGTVRVMSEGAGTGALLIVRIPMMRVPASRRGERNDLKSTGGDRKPSFWRRLRRRNR